MIHVDWTVKTGDLTMTTEAFRQWMMGFKCFLYVWKWSIPLHDNFHGEHDEHIRTGVPKWWVRFSRRLGKNHITSFKKGCIMQTNIPYPKELVEIILGGGPPKKIDMWFQDVQKMMFPPSFPAIFSWGGYHSDIGRIGIPILCQHGIHLHMGSSPMSIWDISG